MEADIRKLLVIYLNQLTPSANVLSEAINKQKDQLKSVVVLTAFEQLKELAAHLKEMKASLAVAPLSELASDEELLSSFELISDLRTALISASN